MNMMKTVLVFKTSISSAKDVQKLQPFLNTVMMKNDLWNFDLEDCDNILRVETRQLKATLISKLLNNHGYTCVELH